VVSTVGEGSTFTLYLPQRYKGAEKDKSLQISDPIKAIPPLAETADFRGRRILLVDDDMRNVFALTTILEARGMQVTYAENGKLGLQMLQERGEFDLVLMDVMMPEMDGIEATQKIRALPKFADLPIISLTAKAMSSDREKCLAAGASDYITKPVDDERLLSLMDIWLKKAEKTRANAV
jgi:CheY-like chemotaxis protein